MYRTKYLVWKIDGVSWAKWGTDRGIKVCKVKKKSEEQNRLSLR